MRGLNAQSRFIAAPARRHAGAKRGAKTMIRRMVAAIAIVAIAVSFH